MLKIFRGILLFWWQNNRPYFPYNRLQFCSVQSLSHVQLFVTPWTAARQASLSITNSQNPPNPMSIVLVMPSNHLILCRPLLLLPPIFPSIRIFQMSQLSASSANSMVRSKRNDIIITLQKNNWISFHLLRAFSRLCLPIVPGCWGQGLN